MVNIFVLLLLIGEGIILGILFFVLRCKHSKYPDFRVGYHVEDIMGSEEKWDYANKTAGNLCGIFGIVFFVISILMYCLKIGTEIALVIMFVLSIIAVVSILLIPIYLTNKH